MLEGNGKCCWKDAVWNARAEDGRRGDSFHSGRFIYFFFFTSRPFVSLFTHRRFPLPFSFYERGIIQAQQALDSHFYANSRIVLVSSSNHTFFSHAKSSISGRRIYHVMLARES